MMLTKTELEQVELEHQIDKLERKRSQLHGYINMKLEEKDYHAIADAAMDLRELEARVQLLKEL